MSAIFTDRYPDGWLSKYFVIPLPPIRRTTALIISGRRHPWPEQLTISVYINGELMDQAEIQEGHFTMQTKMKPVMQGKLLIISSSVFVPKDKGISEDTRKLSFLLDDIVIPELPDAMEPYHDLLDFKPRNIFNCTDEPLWDRLSFILADTYKIPDKEMLHPFKNSLWWDKRSDSLSSISGMVYDKFTGRFLTEGTVQIFNKDQILVRKIGINKKGYYQCKGLPAGAYQVVGQSSRYGDQIIRVHMDGFSKVIHIPMLPHS